MQVRLQKGDRAVDRRLNRVIRDGPIHPEMLVRVEA
jgi:hypothetical protein